MHQNNEDRRRRIQSLSRKLQDIAAARLQLVQELQDLDTQAEQLRSERSMLKTLDTTISHLPDEVLAMIFEEGTIVEMKPSSIKNHSSQHFGVLVSHVARRWRSIALETPWLWTDIQYIAQHDLECHYGHVYLERMLAFLSRAKLSPVDITIMGLGDVDVSQGLLQLMSDHIGHCRRLCVKEIDGDAMIVLLRCVSSRPVPFLSSIHLSPAEEMAFGDQLFRCGAPRLTTVELGYIDICSMHFCLHSFSSVTSLRITDVCSDDEVTYDMLRDSLMSLKALHHLELIMVDLEISPSHSPIVLPTVQLLLVYSDPLDNDLICSIEAPSLIALSLKDPVIPAVLQQCFPSMQHLLVAEMNDFYNFYDFEGNLAVLAQSFPGIKQLTLQNGQYMNNVFKAILCCDSGGNSEGEPVVVLWPKLHTIAVSADMEDFNASGLQDLILQTQLAGRPIRNILLPRIDIVEEGASDALVELGKLVEIGEFHVDWPKPFDCSKD